MRSQMGLPPGSQAGAGELGPGTGQTVGGQDQSRVPSGAGQPVPVSQAPVNWVRVRRSEPPPETTRPAPAAAVPWSTGSRGSNAPAGHAFRRLTPPPVTLDSAMTKVR